MNNITLTKKMKVKLSKAIQAGTINLSDFPELVDRKKYDLSNLSVDELKQLREINRKVIVNDC